MKKEKELKEYQIKSSVSVRARRVVAYIFLIFLTILCLFWFYILFINCTKTHNEINSKFSFTLGKNFLNNWKKLLNDPFMSMSTGFRNTVFVAFSSTILGVYFSTLTAYAIHAYRFKGRDFAYKFIIAIMMIPTQVTSLGFITICRDLNLENNFLPLILPSIASPIVFFYIIQYMKSNLSLSLVEAARIDGSSEFRTFNRVVLPLMKPAIMVQAIFCIVNAWNNYYMPSLLLIDSKKKTLPILMFVLRSRDSSSIDAGMVYMMIAFSIFPILLIYLLLSKFIVSGVTAGGVKG